MIIQINPKILSVADCYVEDIDVEKYEMIISEKIASDLKLDESYLLRIASRSMYYYRTFSIPKRNGGERVITQPSPELKTLQYWVLNNVLKKLPVSQAAFAYKKGDSIKKHAQFHSKNRFILHSDIKDFFPSIRACYLNEILSANKKLFEDIDVDFESSIGLIEQICFRNGILSIGAVSSPVISNIVMKPFDDLLVEYCKENNYLYSRYADDFYISSNSFIDEKVVDFLDSALEKMGFKINRNKTRFYSPKYRRKVTGLILTDQSQISIGTERRTKIKKMIYNKLVNHEGNPDEILGYLSFLKDIEPHTYNNIIIKYSKYSEGDIIDELKKK